MDQALKARLIGATVLVTFAVLLIPELLSGRKATGSGDGATAASPGTRSFTIELAGSAPVPAANSTATPLAGIAPAQPTTSSTPAAPDAASATPAIVSGDDNAAGRVTMPETTTASTKAPSVAGAPGAPQATPTESGPAPTPAAVAPVAASSPAGGGWAVQVGAFSSSATAQKMVDQLKSAGYRAYVSPVSRSGKTLQRVRVGPEADRARAEGLAASLKARNLPATVVAND